MNFANNSLDPQSPWNGHFNWYGRPVFVGAAPPAGGFNDDFAFKTEYIVTEEMVGQPLTFEVHTREAYVVIDGFLFIKDDAWNLLDLHSQEDLDEGILPEAVSGDFNGDGAINAADYVVWRKTDGTQPGYDAWRTNFGSAAGSGALVSASAVPEPSTLVALVLAIGLICVRARTHA